MKRPCSYHDEIRVPSYSWNVSRSKEHGVSITMHLDAGRSLAGPPTACCRAVGIAILLKARNLILIPFALYYIDFSTGLDAI